MNKNEGLNMGWFFNYINETNSRTLLALKLLFLEGFKDDLSDFELNYDDDGFGFTFKNKSKIMFCNYTSGFDVWLYDISDLNSPDLEKYSEYGYYDGEDGNYDKLSADQAFELIKLFYTHINKQCLEG